MFFLKSSQKYCIQISFARAPFHSTLKAMTFVRVTDTTTMNHIRELPYAESADTLNLKLWQRKLMP